MSRDYDAELARAMEKVARIKKAKADALRRQREPIGKVMLELFPDIEQCDTENEIKAFIKAHIQVRRNDEREDTTHGFSDDVFVADSSVESMSSEK